ncbi:MAG: WbqC family protein [Bacteroidales bacterium]|uniref:WbqC family protein n=1 Tax=Porphyromonas sp. TaxID=1924944 RepID=UPI002972958A|nr:WbqC family protein [Porphyromonas sp.]MDD7437349.1 WbqC family protein [Bacteroidales bacterium]MDY3066680.1 WbqC family protein [Porphyromonas sp.]
MISLPSAFLPNTHYLRLIAKGEVATIYIGEQYTKQSFRNRTELLTANGREIFTIPVQKIGYPSPQTSEILISEHGSWRCKMWQLLRSSYQSSPYWAHYSDRIQQLLFYSEPRLTNYNHQWLVLLCSIWGFDTPPISFVEDSFHPEYIDPTFIATEPQLPRYWQVFEKRYGYQPHLSSMDLLLNLGPEGRLYLLDLP